MSIVVLVPAHFLEELRLECSGMDVRLHPYDIEGRPLDGADGARALFRWWISPEAGDELIANYPLSWIHTGSAGVDHILTPRFRSSDIVLTNSAGVHAPSIAEWVLACILAVEKQLPRMLSQKKQRLWEKVERDELKGKHIVILGAGHIASEIAARMRPFGVRLTAIRERSESHPLFDETKNVNELDRALTDADWFIIAAPLTEQTRGSVGARTLSALPSTARLVNVARGEIVDEAALISALRNEAIAGAILDVFAEEPLPSTSPLWEMDNVIVLPHTTWRSPSVHKRQIDLFVDNLKRFIRGEELRNVVDLNEGY